MLCQSLPHVSAALTLLPAYRMAAATQAEEASRDAAGRSHASMVAAQGSAAHAAAAKLAAEARAAQAEQRIVTLTAVNQDLQVEPALLHAALAMGLLA